MHHPFLIGERLYLRRIERSDLAGAYFQWLNDQEVTRWMQNGLFPNSPEAMEAYYVSTATSQSDVVFAVVMKEDDRHVGNLGLHRIHATFRSAEVGVLIGDKQVWGQGVATEAIRLLCDHAFRRMNLNRLFAGAAAPNVGSIRAFEKAGFQREGVARQAYFCGGTYVDCVNLGLLRSDWEALQFHPPT